MAGALIADLNDVFLLEQEGGEITQIPASEIPLETRTGRGTPLVIALFDQIVKKVAKQVLNQ